MVADRFDEMARAYLKIFGVEHLVDSLAALLRKVHDEAIEEVVRLFGGRIARIEASWMMRALQAEAELRAIYESRSSSKAESP